MLRGLKVLATIVALAAGVLLGGYLLARASLPRHSGQVRLPALAAAVTVERDARAVPRIRGESLTDVFRAQGFVHAQERFFEMDLARRATAGELAGLVGRRAHALDAERRPYAFRARAGALVAALPARHRAWLEAYAEGVNAGLADLATRPPEYWLLGAPPAPWSVEDSLLVAFAIYTMLSNNEYYERSQAVMAATLAPEVYRFLTPSATRDDRPLLAGTGDPTGGYRPLAIPPPAAVDFRNGGPVEVPGSIVDPPLMGQAASNQWAVDASRGSRGQAMLANDPHLGFRLPNLFFRAELYWPGHAARGVSIPGLPGIVIGANADVAWGVTVSYADQSDWVVVEVDPADHSRYLTPEGTEPFTTRVEAIEVDGDREPAEALETRWGPVVGRDGLGRPLALKATWLSPDGLNLAMLELAEAGSVEAALAIISRWHGPALSWAVAGSDGTVAWTMNGPIPNRVGFDGSVPVSWADGTRGWRGYQAPPVARRPRGGAVFNANNRSVPLPAADGLSRMWMRSYRAERIEAMLEAEPRFDEADFFRMQLDTRALAYEPIRDLILEVVAEDEPDPALAAARRYAAEWNGRADADEAAFRILQVYYRALLQRVLAPLLAPAFAADARFVYRWPLADEPLMRLLDERPDHLLAPGFADWPAFLRAILSDTLTRIERDSPFELDTPWGVVNRLNVAHPLAGLPVIGHWLRLPPHAQPGSAVSVRVATPTRGAVFRMTVSPAEPELGILQMAGGQSGHFLSPHFMDLHGDWAGDRPTPFLAGATESTLSLLPAGD